MKKLLLSFLILFSLQLTTLKAQWVTIPDTNFVNKLTQLFPSCMSGNQMNTACSQIVNCTSLYLSSSYITDLTGVEYFVNLTTLDCHYNQLTSLPLLPVTLEDLDCGGNDIVSIAQLPNNLKNFDCNNNHLINLPTLPDSLHYLYCNQNEISYLPNLPDSLINLTCFMNQLTYLPVLPSTLKILDCGSNGITYLQLPNSLEELYWGDAQITNLPVLPQSLLVLDCSSGCSCGPYFDSLPQLPSSLQKLFCGNRGLTSIPQLPGSLETLACESNSLINLPALPQTLQELYCGSSQLTNLPSLPNSLHILSCSNNQLTNLPSLPNSLQNLNCSSNQISSIPVLPANLIKLYCYDNQLINLPPVPNVMYEFYIQNNNISCIFNLPQVNGANISNNPITCVPNQTNYSLGLPLCLDNDTVNNPNNCISTVNIAGYVFTDNFGINCTYNSYDLASANIPVKLYDSLNTLVAQSYTSGGTFGFMVNQVGAYKVKVESNNLPIGMACSQPDSQTVNLVSLTNGVNANFPVQCAQAFDLNVQSVNALGIVFPGQTHTLHSNISNNENWFNLNCTTATYSGTVIIDVTGPITYLSPANNALVPIVSGNTFTHTISNFNILNPNSFDLLFQTDTNALTGNPICVNINVSANPNDIDTLNNVYDFCYQVVNSYDPNMKEVYPVNVSTGYDDWFTYTIHFQNTGNAPAFNIRLRDTLDANLDINSFEVRGYSHPAQISLNGNILTVRFNNIMLPDSTTDYEGSMGYFQYRLKPLPNLPNGTQIENTAYIYFDYNATIITNTTLNNFDITVKTNNTLPQASHLSLYPNPSNGIFTFNESKNIKTVEVFNMMGELVLTQGNAKIINLQAYPKGIYVARINGSQVCRLVKE